MMSDVAFTDELLDLFASDQFDEDFDSQVQDISGGSSSDGDTSSESMNSGARSSPQFHFSYQGSNDKKFTFGNDIPARNLLLPRAVPPPSRFVDRGPTVSHHQAPLLSSHESVENVHDTKRLKRDDRLIKNRESANKSRMKRKNEKVEMEETIAHLRDRIKDLELENTALVTDNTSLTSQNLFLRSLLTEREKELAKKHDDSFRGSVSGVAILCVVCACSFANEWIPSVFKIQSATKQHRLPGRVLLSLAESSSADLTAPFLQAVDRNPQSMLHLCLILAAAFGYVMYMRYQNAKHSKKTFLP
jgi:hypothetical protein